MFPSSAVTHNLRQSVAGNRSPHQSMLDLPEKLVQLSLQENTPVSKRRNHLLASDNYLEVN